MKANNKNEQSRLLLLPSVVFEFNFLIFILLIYEQLLFVWAKQSSCLVILILFIR